MNRLLLPICFACLMAAAAAVSASECVPCAACTLQQPVATTSLSPQWRNNAYYGMLRQINPKHTQNVKFLFLGDPVPAVLRGGKKQPDMHGYGGLVAVRKKSILWMVKGSVRFYLLDANGNLLALRDIDSMSESDVSPKFYDVDITVTTNYVPNPNVSFPTYDKNGLPEYGSWMNEPAYIWVTEEVKTVTPILDAYNQERLRAFRKAPINQLPVCQ